MGRRARSHARAREQDHTLARLEAEIDEAIRWDDEAIDALVETGWIKFDWQLDGRVARTTWRILPSGEIHEIVQPRPFLEDLSDEQIRIRDVALYDAIFLREAA